ncbi:MAG: FecR family protein [Saprospiraceae bacterium]
MIDIKDILDFIEDNSDESKKQEVRNWSNLSSENSKEIEFYKKVIDMSPDLKDELNIDINKSWQLFEKEADFKENNFNLRKIIYYTSAIAASVAIIFFVVKIFFFQEPLYKETITNNYSDTIKLIDGSFIFLKDNSKAVYYTRLDSKIKERNVEIHGSAQFDVAHNENYPFIVKANDAGIRVLGTKFDIKIDGSKIECDNNEGTVKLFEWQNPDNSIILNTGDKAVFDGGKIEKILPPPPPPPAPPKGKMYSVEHVIEYFFDKYITLVNTSPYSDIEMDDRVFVNLNQPLDDIIQQLDSTANIKYIENCKGCYEFSVFKAK